MLKSRIITALILIPLFVSLVLFLPPIPFCILTGLIILIGAWEWSAFLGIKKLPYNLIYPIIINSILFISLELPLVNILYIAIGWWILAFFLIVMYPRMTFIWSKSLFVRGLMGIFVLVPSWLAINFIRNAENGTYILLFLFILIWGADTGAFFVGRKWGKNKLAAEISPGKTWEGVFGALLITIIITFFALIILKLPYAIWLKAFLLTLMTVLFSIGGDLFESMLKRNVGLKDSSHLLPGHGGILDRIDSITAAAPFFAVGALWMTKFS